MCTHVHVCLYECVGSCTCVHCKFKNMYECSGVCLCVSCGSSVISLQGQQIPKQSAYTEKCLCGSYSPCPVSPTDFGFVQGFMEGVHAETKLLTSWPG